MTERAPAPGPRMPGATSPETELTPVLAELLGVHLAEVEARLDAWGAELRGALAGPPATSRVVPPVDAVAAPATPAPPPEPALTALLRLDALQGGWAATLDARLENGGLVEVTGARHAAGIAAAPIPAPAAQLLRLAVDLAAPPDGEGAWPVLRVANELGEPLAADLACGAGLTAHVVFVPRRTRELRLQLLLPKPRAGLRFVLRGIELQAVETEAYQAGQAHAIGAPVIASLASIPERRAMLADAVGSLLPQCDTVRVFLNGYPDVPDFLLHPRIEVRRSEDWDDKGDAGKFAWIEAADPPGYRIVADDDLVFPPDFAREAVAALRRYGDEAFVGLHGILLRQPLRRYYADASRHSVHFASPLHGDRTVHLLGTNAFCFHASRLGLRWADFAHRNMADIFVALHAQRRGIPMVAMARPRDWVRQNRQDHAFDTIYDASVKGTGSSFDTSRVQDALVRRGWPLTLQPTPRPKLVFCLLAAAAEAAEAALASWQAFADPAFDWAVILCQVGDHKALADWIEAARTPHELHLVREAGQGPAARIGAALRLAERIGGRVLLLATDELRIDRGGWAGPLAGLAGDANGFAAFGHRDPQGRLRLGRDPLPPGGALPPLTVAALPLAAGDLDDRLPGAPLALRDWLARLAAATPGKGPDLPDLAAALRAAAAGAWSAHLPGHGLDPAWRAGWRRVLPPPAPVRRVNDAFERVCVINLDRRRDRWAAVRGRFERAGIRAERVAAVDGASPDLRGAWDAYAARPLAPVPDGVRAVTSSGQFYRDHDSQAARLAFEERRTGRKAIASSGALAYLMTWQAILERAIEDGVGTLLVFDDDVAFHRALPDLFAAAWQELPPDWLVLQLGTLQYAWDAGAMIPAGRHLYRTGGTAIGSHAVGLRFEVLPFLLEQVRRRDMPFDTGALSAASHAFADRCFVVTPNAAIQTLEDSDIGTSGFQKGKALDVAARTYRWHLPDYDLPPGALAMPGR